MQTEILHHHGLSKLRRGKGFEMDLTQIDSQPEEYFLSCAKCQHDGGTGVCVDDVWFFDPRAGTYEGSESSSLFCCTSCISWFSKHSRNWFQDDIAREWIRITKSALRKWDRESWADSEEKSAAFVENITRKQSDKKTNQKKSKKRDVPPLALMELHLETRENVLQYRSRVNVLQYPMRVILPVFPLQAALLWNVIIPNYIHLFSTRCPDAARVPEYVSKCG